ncbi:MAG TPA: hypothetical protein VFB29_01435 [Pseudolabrys sp.]|nr:hypothetical protein [Pseudolabrys sp.]
MTIGSVLKIGLGIVCFGFGAACLIAALSILPFISLSDAAIPGAFMALAVIFLSITYLLLRRVRWHIDQSR